AAVVDSRHLIQLRCVLIASSIDLTTRIDSVLVVLKLWVTNCYAQDFSTTGPLRSTTTDFASAVLQQGEGFLAKTAELVLDLIQRKVLFSCPLTALLNLSFRLAG